MTLGQGLSLGVAALAPALVVGGWLGWGGALAEPTTPPPPSAAVRALVDRMQAGPEVVILGNSQALSAVDAEALADRLGLPGRVAHAGAGGANAPTAYAILRHRVFGAGARPRLILVPMSAAHLLDVRAPTGNQALTLQQMMDGPDDVLDAKVFGVRNRALDRAVGASQALRERVLSAITVAPLRWTGAADPQRRMDAARDAVFGEVAGSQLVLNARMIPVVEGSSRPDAPTDDVDLDSTLVPDLLDLAAAHGARIVFVTLPQRARHLATPPGLLRTLSAFLADHGSALLRLDQQPIPSDAWLDPGHLNPRGAAVLTEALARALGQVGALDEGPLRALPPPLEPPSVTRVGAPPVPRVLRLRSGPHGLVATLDGGELLSDTALAAQGHGQASPLEVRIGGAPLAPHLLPTQGCAPSFRHVGRELHLCVPPDTRASDLALSWAPTEPHGRRAEEAPGQPEDTAWWLPAGGALQLAWDPPLELPADSAVELLLAPLEDGADGWTLRADGRAAAVTTFQGIRTARLALDDRLGTLRIEAGTGAPHAFVRALIVRRGDDATWVAGSPEDRADRLVLVPGRSFVPSPRGVPPREVSPSQITVRRHLTWPVTGPDAALDERRLIVAGQDERYGRCLPFEAVPGPGAFPLKSDLRQTEGGRAWLPLRSSDPDPAPEAVWSLRTRPSRVCGGAAWIAPGEAVRFTAAAPQSLAVTVDELEIALAAFDATGAVRLELAADGRAMLDASLDAASLDGRPLTLPLTKPLPPRPERLTLAVTGPTDGWSLVGTVSLIGADVPAEAWSSPAPAAPPRLTAPDVVTPPPVALRSAGRPPEPQATIIATLLDAADLYATPDQFALHPKASTLAVDGPGLVLSAPDPSVRPLVCLPDLPAGPLRVTATVRVDGDPATVDLAVRWIGGEAAEPAENAASARARDVAAQPQLLALDATPPKGATAARVCLRGPGAPLRVDAWRVEATRP